MNGMATVKGPTGYPSVDKPWLIHYPRQAMDEPLPECNMYEYMLQNNQEHMQNYALNFYGTKLTYQQLVDLIERTARAFLNLKVQAGETVSLVMLSCIPSVVCMYALNRIGAVTNYINVLSSEDDMVTYFQDGASETVVALDLFGDKVVAAAKRAGVKQVILHDLSDYMPLPLKIGFKMKTRRQDHSFYQDDLVIRWKQFLAGADQCAMVDRLSTDDICYLAHTGGTTGFPKSVLLKNASFNAVAQTYVYCFPHEVGDPFLSTIVPFVVYGSIINIHMPLCLGLETVLLPKFDADEWPAYIKKYHPKHICSIPAYIAPIAELESMKNLDLSCMQTIGMGGEGMNVPMEIKLNDFLTEHRSSAKIVKGYGMTEVCATACSEFPFACKIGSVGIPLMHNVFMIYDNDAQVELPYDQSGEICMQCASEMVGYKDNAEETERLYRIHSDGSRWIHTGDIGHMDEEGFLFVEGRMKRMIMTIYDGVVYKVFPEIIADQLSHGGSVSNISIVGDTRGKDLVLRACVIPSPEYKGDIKQLEEDLRAYAGQHLSMYMRPVYYSFCTEFPRTPVGKIDYRALEEMYTF